jgi:hypothetical protein
MEDKRTLTDADVDALAERLEKSVLQRFQLNIGRGVLALLWKWFMLALLALAAYGAGGGFKKWGG